MIYLGIFALLLISSKAQYSNPYIDSQSDQNNDIYEYTDNCQSSLPPLKELDTKNWWTCNHNSSNECFSELMLLTSDKLSSYNCQHRVCTITDSPMESIELFMSQYKRLIPVNQSCPTQQPFSSQMTIIANIILTKAKMCYFDVKAMSRLAMLADKQNLKTKSCVEHRQYEAAVKRKSAAASIIPVTPLFSPAPLNINRSTPSLDTHDKYAPKSSKDTERHWKSGNRRNKFSTQHSNLAKRDPSRKYGRISQRLSRSVQRPSDPSRNSKIQNPLQSIDSKSRYPTGPSAARNLNRSQRLNNRVQSKRSKVNSPTSGLHNEQEKRRMIKSRINLLDSTLLKSPNIRTPSWPYYGHSDYFLQHLPFMHQYFNRKMDKSHQFPSSILMWYLNHPKELYQNFIIPYQHHAFIYNPYMQHQYSHLRHEADDLNVTSGNISDNLWHQSQSRTFSKRMNKNIQSGYYNTIKRRIGSAHARRNQSGSHNSIGIRSGVVNGMGVPKAIAKSAKRNLADSAMGGNGQIGATSKSMNMRLSTNDSGVSSKKDSKRLTRSEVAIRKMVGFGNNKRTLQRNHKANMSRKQQSEEVISTLNDDDYEPRILNGPNSESQVKIYYSKTQTPSSTTTCKLCSYKKQELRIKLYELKRQACILRSRLANNEGMLYPQRLAMINSYHYLQYQINQIVIYLKSNNCQIH